MRPESRCSQNSFSRGNPDKNPPVLYLNAIGSILRAQYTARGFFFQVLTLVLEAGRSLQKSETLQMQAPSHYEP